MASKPAAGRGDDQGYRFADKSDSIASQQGAVGLRRGSAVGAGKADAAGNRGDIRQVSGGVNGDDAGDGSRGGWVDCSNVGVGVGRTEESRDGDVRRRGVVGVISLAGQ
jgi:hypothetical protein